MTTVEMPGSAETSRLAACRGLTERNRGFIPSETQERLGRARLLVAGCGSTGGAVVEPLARLGVQHFVLADCGRYELNNLNRQNAFQRDIGRNKAVVCAERVADINPAAGVVVDASGIGPDNVRSLMTGCDAVIDGVDVTERSGWRAKFLLHATAAEMGIPVVTGWDMAGTQYVRYYDYRRGGPPLAGRITADEVERADLWVLLRRAVPMRAVPVEMLDFARSRREDVDVVVPQLVYASLLFGAVASRMVLEILEGGRVRRHVVVDGHRVVRTPGRNLHARLRKPWVVAMALTDLLRRARRLRDRAVPARRQAFHDRRSPGKEA